ncbi:MAG: DUF1559 domain-containing protein [Planctomycetaceae bacterium]|nr:DUF1559 domain-containing protein [Planctomycetaceae bacterium]
MSTTEASELPIQPSREQPCSNFHAFCSLVLPGLGQLLQKRTGTAVGFFLLFILSGFLPLLIVSLLFRDRFSHATLWEHILHIGIFGVLFFLFVAAITWSVLDAAHEQKEKTEEKQKHRFLFTPWTIVAAILGFGILIFLLFPFFPTASEAARRMQCTNNLKQIMLAFHNYHAEHGHFPPAYTVDETGKPLHSWRVLILPYVEHNRLYEQIRLDEPWDSEYNRQFHSEAPAIFRCPSALSGEPDFVPASSGSFYSVIDGAESAFFGSQPRIKDEIEEGLSNTIFLVERRVPVNWMDPSRELSFAVAVGGVNVDAMGISSYHPGGASVAFGDGSVRFITNAIDAEILRQVLILHETESRF